jgi:hypothetical protein
LAAERAADESVRKFVKRVGVAGAAGAAFTGSGAGSGGAFLRLTISRSERAVVSSIEDEGVLPCSPSFSSSVTRSLGGVSSSFAKS